MAKNLNSPPRLAELHDEFVPKHSKSKKPRCFLCGASNPATRDHIPPKGFFPAPRPQDLITVSCCNTCNQSYAMDDEAFRLFVSVAEGVSPAGKWIRENKTFARTLTNSPKLVENIAKSMSTQLRDGEAVDVLSLPIERGHRFLTRLTKGVLAYFHPSIDTRGMQFTVRQVSLKEAEDPTFIQLRDSSIYDSRGEQVFQFRRLVNVQGGFGIWMYVFYGASLFLVSHKL